MAELKNSINNIIEKFSFQAKEAVKGLTTGKSTEGFGDVERSILSKRISNFFQRLDKGTANAAASRNDEYPDFNYRDYSDFRDYYDHDAYRDRSYTGNFDSREEMAFQKDSATKISP